MAKRSKAKLNLSSKGETSTKGVALKGWKQIARFLGEPVSVVKRWRGEGMPVSEQGRFVSSSADDLNAWLGRESGKPVHVVTPETDLNSELKRALAFARRGSKSNREEK